MKTMNVPGQVSILYPLEVHLFPQGHSEPATGSYKGLGKIGKGARGKSNLIML